MAEEEKDLEKKEGVQEGEIKETEKGASKEVLENLVQELENDRKDLEDRIKEEEAKIKALAKEKKEEKKQIKKQKKQKARKEKGLSPSDIDFVALLKTNIIVQLSLAVIVIGLAVGGFMIKKNLDAKKSAIFDLPESTYNLQSENDFMQLDLALEYKGLANLELITENGVKMKDVIIQTVGDRSRDELLTSEGKSALKKDLIKKLNSLLENDIFSQIYFEKYIIQ